ncbi:hypothetical protein CYMTET_55253 [Cymbomonas tetramitiformis]|uniref:Helicase C-terminal domain-containing protein n=1 Tax=Cymbomonas tetramitiformis TaxID=36881 RepID=A0AAE0BDP9_9CHLO|nr:hypothetical protein CYMTET_55253 [Cymbomonas tetramitiformis]
MEGGGGVEGFCGRSLRVVGLSGGRGAQRGEGGVEGFCGRSLRVVGLSGGRGRRRQANEMRPYAASTRRWVILMLHSALSVEEQDKVFDLAPEGVRKCILSTNIAETSVTIDGIRFVVDSGRAKEMVHDPRTGMASLQECWISKASADQRKGRAGRTGPGVAFRLYSKEEFDKFPDFTPPEVHKIPLESVVLQIKQLRMAEDPRRFPFIEPPADGMLASAVVALKEQEALSPALQLTPLGAALASLPVSLHIGKILILGSLFHLKARPFRQAVLDSGACLSSVRKERCELGAGLSETETGAVMDIHQEHVITMAAAMSVQSPYIRLGSSDASETTTLRMSMESPHGDPFTLLNIFNEWIRIKHRRSESSFKWCRRHGLEEQRLYEIAKLQKQFEGVLSESGVAGGEARAG